MISAVNELGAFMDNIVLVGLVYDQNLGDRAIFESTLNMIEEIQEDINVKFEIKVLDLYGRTKSGKSYEYDILKKILRKAYQIRKRPVDEATLICKIVSQRFRALINKNTKAVIFVGGG